MLRRLFGFIGSIFMYIFEEIADEGKLKKRQEPIFGDLRTPVEERNLPTIRLD